jgi:pilus assembly protein CpaC
VTPHLVDPQDCGQLTQCLPGQETRSPDDFELFLEGILEAPRGPREVFPNGHYTPAYKHASSADLFPCGNGHNGNGYSGGCNGGCHAGCHGGVTETHGTVVTPVVANPVVSPVSPTPTTTVTAPVTTPVTTPVAAAESPLAPVPGGDAEVKPANLPASIPPAPPAETGQN